MYEAYWELTTRPFHRGWDPDYYFPARGHEACLARLAYLIQSREGVAVLLGTSGVGKSTVVRILWNRLSKNISPRVHLCVGGLSAQDILVLLARHADEEEVPWTSSPLEAAEFLRETLSRNAAAGRHAVIVLDDAHLATDSRLWEFLHSLSDLRDRNGAIVTTILVGQMELGRRLLQDSAWEERLSTVSILRALSRRETHQYVEKRLTAAGATRTIFVSHAIDRVYELSGGIPSKINRLCDLALLVGAAEEAEVILPEHVEVVAGEITPGELDRGEPPALAA
ncbi:MAG: AAA family ATPase [Thermoguttaceae bacterium]|nr:AAA family ATPase [Thermoguttaceae bacterium]MDW8078126.1 AAA family ATPase [Thermoguttaceae bacterium]